MTLIIALTNKITNETVFLSDCLLSRESVKPNPINFGIHFGSNQKIDSVGVDMVSKMASRGKSYILGAGSVPKLKAIFEEFLSVSHKDQTEFQSFLDSVYFDKPKTESLIYGFEGDAGHGFADSYCRREEGDHFILQYGGSGSRFIDKILENLQPEASAPTINWARDLLAMLLRAEFEEYGFHKYAIGAAYEIFAPSEIGIQRVPYTIIDFSGESVLAKDGVFDLYGPKIDRVIFSIPREDGSLFLICPDPGSGRIPTVFDAMALDAQPFVWNDAERDNILAKCAGLEPEFDIILIRHQIVNWTTAFRCANLRLDEHGEPRVEFDHARIGEALSHWRAD